MRRQMPSGSQTLFPALGQGRRWQQFESDRDSGTQGTAEEENVLVSDCECANHHNNLSETCVVAAVDTRMVPWMYSACLFLGMGGNSFRLVQGVADLVDRFLDTSADPPPVDCQIHRAEVKNFAMVNWKSYQRAIEDDEDDGAGLVPTHGRERRRMTEYSKAWDAYLEFFNGWLVLPDGVTRLPVHHCSGETCCASKAITKHKAISAILRVVLRNMPAAPTKGKWTKLMPCLAWFVIALTSGVIQPLMPLAFGKLHFQLLSANDQWDQVYRMDVAYQALQGQRFNTFMSGLENQFRRTCVLILAIVIEPLTWLARWHLRSCSHSRKRRDQSLGKPAPLSDLCSWRHSPAVLVLEYLSFMAAGQAPRLALLWSRKHTCFEEWADANPLGRNVLRRGVAVAASWVHLRSYRRFQVLPWKLASLSDPRIDTTQKVSLAEDVLGHLDSNPEMIDEGFTAPLLAHLVAAGLGPEALLQGIYRRLLWMWSWSVMTTVAPVEFQHGRNRRRAHAAQNWAHFVAGCVNDEARRTFQMLIKSLTGGHTASAVRAAQPKRIRRQSVRDLFHQEYCDAQKSMGLRVQIGNAEWHI